ncbi:MAG TPA: hypothetical protein VET69_10090 [Terriglobales bacterium]|nr:hypothetical protein [Terriglobales bacterium]
MKRAPAGRHISENKLYCPVLLSAIFHFLLAVMLLSAALAQSPAQPPEIPAGRNAQFPAAAAETHITQAQADELFRSVDQILAFASRDSGLPIRRPVKRALVSREQAMKYIQGRMGNDQDAQRLQRSALVLKKFGLLPSNFDLQAFLLALLREQVAGYYDPKAKTVNLLDWVDADIQKPVLAHELTHALQDQDSNLDHWLKDGPPSEKKDPDVQDDEAVAARQAVSEGQAMVVLTDYELEPMGKTILDAPEIVAAMKAGVTSGSPIFESAPLYIKDSLAFPYTYGLDFERMLLQKKGKEAAFAEVLQHPPLNTREVMQPAVYLAGEHLPPLHPPKLEKVLGKSWQKIDVGAVGEFDISVMVEQYASEEAARQVWPQWRGGYYYATRQKNAPPGNLSLLYFSQWAVPEQATKFAGIYARSLKKKYKQVQAVGGSRPASSPASAGVQVSIADATTQWNTEDGPVFVEPHGQFVLVMEGFDTATASKLRDAVLPATAQ